MDWDCRFFAHRLQMEFWIADILSDVFADWGFGAPTQARPRQSAKTCDTLCGLQIFCRLGFRGGPTTALCKTSANKSAKNLQSKFQSAKHLQKVCKQSAIKIPSAKKSAKKIFSGHISFPRSRLSKAYSLHPTSEDREVLFLTRGVGLLDC